jgi:hypothetical protein
MTRLVKTVRTEPMKIRTWAQAREVANALLSFLGLHCPSCGRRHTRACVDGGRCTYCGRMLNGVASLGEALEEGDVAKRLQRKD